MVEELRAIKWVEKFVGAIITLAALSFYGWASSIVSIPGDIEKLRKEIATDRLVIKKEIEDSNLQRKSADLDLLNMINRESELQKEILRQHNEIIKYLPKGRQ